MQVGDTVRVAKLAKARRARKGELGLSDTERSLVGQAGVAAQHIGEDLWRIRFRMGEFHGVSCTFLEDELEVKISLWVPAGQDHHVEWVPKPARARGVQTVRSRKGEDNAPPSE